MLEKLLGPHPSQPHNPDIVNAMFRTGGGGAAERPDRWDVRPSVVKESLATAGNGTQCQLHLT